MLESDTELDEVVKLFIRTGYTKFAGYLVGGMKAWDNAVFELEEVGQMTVHEVKEGRPACKSSMCALLPSGKRATFPAQCMPSCRISAKKAARLAKTKPVAVYCDSGYRASIGTSILKQEGFRVVSNVPGSWQAWKKAKFPIEGGDAE